MVAGGERDITNTDHWLRNNNRLDAFRITTHPRTRRSGDPDSLRTPQTRAMSQPSLFSDEMDDKSQLPYEAILTDEGTKLKFNGDYVKALDKYRKAAEQNPEYAPAYYNIAVVYSENQDYQTALDYYNLALEKNPKYVEAFCNMGVIYKNIQEPEKAIYYYKEALKINPNFKIARNNLAIAFTDLGTNLKKQGEYRESIKCYKQALVNNAMYPDAYYNLGVAYGELGSLEKAIVFYELAIHFNPQCCEAYNNLGVIFKDRDNLERATECYVSALQVDPRYYQTLNNLSVVFTMQGNLDAAREFANRALSFYPNYSEAYNNLGVIYREEGDTESAIQCYQQCLSNSGGDADARNAYQNLLLALNYRSKNIHEVFECHQKWGINFQNTFPPCFDFTNRDRTSDRILRIGYLCPEFCVHNLAYFIEGIILSHDTSRFEIYCYSNVVKEENHAVNLHRVVKKWVNVYNKSSNDAANLIYNDNIDILLDLSGHTAGNRIGIVALSPAPIQVSYLLYPNTTGLPSIRYRLCDNITDPLDTKQEYTEQLVRLQRCFLCYRAPTNPPIISQVSLTKNGYVTFGFFNNLAQVTPDMIKIWIKILQKIPNSHLVMRCKPFATASLRDKYINQFTNNGIESHRLDFKPLFPRNFDHLKAYQSIDISLDSWPYCGTITTCESLFMGVPVITMSGQTHASNIGKSILSQVDLQNWVATTTAEYITIAEQYANEHTLHELRGSLRNRILQSPLCDCMGFTRNLEQIYSKMWQRYIHN